MNGNSHHETPAEYLRRKGWQFKAKGRQLSVRRCPYCAGGEHGDTFTFAVESESGAWNCMRGSCGKSGHFGQLRADFGDETVRQWQPRAKRVAVTPEIYRAPATPLTAPPDAVTAYLALRGFSAQTIATCRVHSDEAGNVVFPYYEAADAAPVMLKFRRPAKYVPGEGQKAWREKGGKPVLWLLDQARPAAGPLVIVFGEYDAMTLVECGVPNVVSVPSGDQDMTWISLDFERLTPFSRIVLWPDNDESGRKVVDEISRRLGVGRVQLVSTEHKDANEMLHRLTRERGADAAKQAIRESVAGAGYYPVENLIRVCDIPDDDIIRDGTLYGIRELDALTGGAQPGEVTIWAGDNGSGKTTGVLKLCAIEAINQRVPVFVWSGEMSRSRVKYWSERMMAGPEYLRPVCSERTGRDYYEFTDANVTDWLRWWYADYYYLYDTRTVRENELFEAAEIAYQRYGCKRFVFDNLMLMTLANEGKDELLAQARFVERCKRFAQDFGVTVDVAAHTRKPFDGNKPPTKHDVKGAGEITNLADNAFAFWRVPENVQDSADFLGADALLCVFKTRETGEQTVIRLAFDAPSKRLVQLTQREAGLGNCYGWHAALENARIQSGYVQ